MTFTSFNPFSEARTSSWFPSDLSLERATKLLFELLSHDFFLFFAGFLQKGLICKRKEAR